MNRVPAIALAVAASAAFTTAQAQYSARSVTPKVPGLTTASGSGGFLQGADNCASAHTNAGTGDVSGVPFTTGTTGTTGQNEANCYFFGTTGVDQDVWFNWTANTTANARVTTCAFTGVDTKIAVWPLSTCPTDGTSLACNDDACGLQSTTVWAVTSGTTYTLQVGTFPGGSGGAGTFDVTQVAPPPCGAYDDGTTENALGLTAGGEMGWIHRFTCVQSFNHIDTAFGTAMFPGSVTNGNNASVAGWHAPAGTVDPNALGAADTRVNTVVVNGDTDILNKVDIGGTRTLGPGEVLFVMATADHVAGQFPGPMDQDNPTPESWVVGSTLGPGTLDQDNLSNNNVPPMNMTAIGFPASWLLRVTGDAPPEPGTPLCFGDGSGAPCGCGNESPAGEGRGCNTHFPGTNNPGDEVDLGGRMTAAGSNSILAQKDDTTPQYNPLTIVVQDVTTQPGLVFSGQNTIGGGVGQTFGDGIRCCGQNVIRHELIDLPPTGAGQNFPADGFSTVDLTLPTGTITPGDKRCYQYWFRNPGARSLCGSNFNLTNAITVTWQP